MFRFIKYAALSLVIVAASVCVSQAGGYHGHSHHYHGGYGGGYYGGGGYGYGYNGGGWGYGYGYQPRGHFDYYPTSIYRHGDHFHVQPGHYHYHRGGHGRW